MGVYFSCFVASVATIHVVLSRCVQALYPDQCFGGGGKSQPVTEESKERQLQSCREHCKQQTRGNTNDIMNSYIHPGENLC